MNYKEWIMNRADEIALDKHDTEYEYLPEDLKRVMVSIAERDYHDMMSMRAEYGYGCYFENKELLDNNV